MKPLNLSQFHKIKEDKKMVTMAHPSGHTINIFKDKLPAIQRKQIERLPMHFDEGGSVEYPSAQPNSEPVPTEVKKDEQKNDDTLVNNVYSQTAQNYGDQQAPSIPSAPDSQTNSSLPLIPQANSALSIETGENNQQGSTDTNSVGNTPTDKYASLNPLDSYTKGVSAINEEANAKSNLALEQAKMEHQQQADLQLAQTQWNAKQADMQNDISKALEDVKNNHIKPNAYLENMNTGQKIGTAIGLILGGFNKNGINPAQVWLNDQINRDISAQKNQQETYQNIYNANLDKYKNAAVAENMTRATQMQIYASKIKEATDNATSPIEKARGQLAQVALENQAIPLINNAHLISQLSQFNGSSPNGVAGSEAQYKVALNSAQRINPELYKDQQSKYIPGVGVASHPVDAKDIDRLSRLNSLIPLLDKAIAHQTEYGKTGAWSVKNRADADSDIKSINVRLNELTGLNRLNDREYQNYGEQIGKIGGVNLGGTLETIKNLRAQAESDRNSAITAAGVVPFAQSQYPTGLNQQQQSVFNMARQKYPNAQPGILISELRKQGKI